jgi:uncharacterized small protein (DUF1192 family)
MRGPPSVPASKRKNSVNGSSKEKKERAPHSKKQRSHADEDQVVGLWPLPTEASSTTSATAAVANTTNTNIDTISILNFLGMMNPTNSTLISSNMLQNQHQEGTSLTRSPLDPISAALQQPAFCIPAIAMAKGLAGGVPINWAHDITHASSNTKQPFAYSQQLLQELLQPQSAQQQLQPQSAQQQQSQQSQVHQELLHPSVQQQQLLPQPSAQQQQLQQSQVLQKLLQELAMTMAQGQVGGAPDSRGHDATYATQPLAYSQQLPQELPQPLAQQQQQLEQLQVLLKLLKPPARQPQQLQQLQVLQQLLQPPSQQQQFLQTLVQQQQQLLQLPAQHLFPTSTEAKATVAEESPLSSSEEEEDGRTTLSLLSEVKQLRKRVNNLEEENERLKQEINRIEMTRE